MATIADATKARVRLVIRPSSRWMSDGQVTLLLVGQYGRTCNHRGDDRRFRSRQDPGRRAGAAPGASINPPSSRKRDGRGPNERASSQQILLEGTLGHLNKIGRPGAQSWAQRLPPAPLYKFLLGEPNQQPFGDSSGNHVSSRSHILFWKVARHL